MTFDLAREEFKDFLLLECAFSKHTISAYMRNVEKLENFLSINGLKLLPSDVQLEHLISFVSWLNETGDFASASQAQVVATVKTFFKFLVMSDVIRSSPAEFLLSPKKELLLPVYLSVSEVHQIIDAAKHNKPFTYRAVAIVSTLYATGIRVSEMIQIKLEDLHFDLGMIKVLGKGNKERLVPIAAFAKKAVMEYVAIERNNFSKQKSFYTHLFITEHGKPLQREYVWTLIKSLAKRANIKKSVSPHTFRHTLATHLKQAGADLNIIKEILGHESISDTIKYAHLDMTSLAKAINNHPVNL